jgi:hypothetical protein
LVPLPLANRVVNEYGVFSRTPLSVETVPVPVLISPCHWIDALRFISFLHSQCFEAGWRSRSGVFPDRKANAIAIVVIRPPKRRLSSLSPASRPIRDSTGPI